VRVNTHIESRGTGTGNGLDVTSQEIDLVKDVQQTTDSLVGEQACHDVRIRSQGDGRLDVSLHCFFAADLPLVQVHDASTRVETKLLETLPRLERVLVHAEPAPPSKPI
jgi:divalent metal cation (Fe/Co/Zn/Cd) transporter